MFKKSKMIIEPSTYFINIHFLRLIGQLYSSVLFQQIAIMDQKISTSKTTHKNPPLLQKKRSIHPIQTRFEKKDSKKVKPNQEEDSSQSSEDAIHQNKQQKEGQKSSISAQQSQDSPLSSSLQQAQSPNQQRNASQSQQPQEQFKPFLTRELFQIIIQHLSQNIPNSDRKSRLDYLLLQIKQKAPLKEIMNKFDKKDLAIIAQHKKLIEILDRNFYLILQKVEYSKFKHLNYKKMILSTYDSLGMEASLSATSKILQKKAAESNLEIVPIILQLISIARKQFQSNSIKQASEEDELILKAIEQKQTEKMLFADPFADFQLNQQHRFDQVSKYGVFSNKKEQGQLSREGVFNYRLHRTMAIIQKMGIMNPQENIKLAKNLAIFIIKLTDHHIQQIISQSMKLASITSRSINNQTKLNQVTYFSKTNFKSKNSGIGNRQASSQQYPNSQYKVNRLKYPTQMKMYQNLRSMEIIEQDNLCSNLHQDISKYLFNNKKRLNKQERIAIEYFTKKPNTVQCITKLKADVEKQQAIKPVTTGIKTRISVKPRHIRHFLENHPFYRNHQIMWRFNIVY